MTTLAQVRFRCNKNRLYLLVVVDGVARKARQPRLGVGGTKIDGMTTSAALLDDLGRGSREALDLFRITTALDMRASRPVTRLTALRLCFLHLQGMDVCGSGEGLVLVLVTALADFRAHVLRGFFSFRMCGRFLPENSSAEESNHGKTEHQKRCPRANQMHGTPDAAIACLRQEIEMWTERRDTFMRRERREAGGCGRARPNVPDRTQYGDPD